MPHRKIHSNEAAAVTADVKEMGLTMEQRKAVASEMGTRYRQASKKQKGQIIEGYMGLTGCARHHVGWLVACWGTRVWDRHDGQLVKIVVGQRGRWRHTRRVYEVQTVAALTKLWRHFGYLCRQALGGHAASVAAGLRELEPA